MVNAASVAAVDYTSIAPAEQVSPALRRALVSDAVRVLLQLAWPFTWPARWYWSHSEHQVGKKLLVDRLLKQLLPSAPAEFEAELTGGGRVFLQHRDDIGTVVLLTGAFEPAETACARDLTSEGSVAIDVGANVGMFTVPLAMAVGPLGRVLALEPSSENARRLVRNLEVNGLDNVDVHAAALAEKSGEVLLRLGADPAFHSTTTVVRAHETCDCAVVEAQTLDSVWQAAGSPEVSFLKIDTEGGELEILRGGRGLLRALCPPILIEAKGRARVRELDAFLLPLGYERTRPRGFAVGNYLYSALGERVSATASPPLRTTLLSWLPLRPVRRRVPGLAAQEQLAPNAQQ